MKTLCSNFIAASLLLLLPASLYACQQDEGTQNDAAGNTPDTPTDSAPAISAPSGSGGADGFGDSGIGDGSLADDRQESSNGVMITWSEKNDELRGFSIKLGDWEVISIEPQDQIIRQIGDTVAAVRFGDSVAAFSGEKGWWDVIELSKDSKAVPVCHPSLVAIEDNGHLYTFAAEKAQWTSPTDTTLQPGNLVMKLEIKSSDEAEYQSKCSGLQEEFRKWSESLPRYKRNDRFMAFHSRERGTINLMVARQRWVPETKSKMEELCRLVEAQYSANGSLFGVDATNRTIATELEEQISALQVKLNALRSATPEASDFATKQPDKAALLSQVTQAFDVRQQLQQLEAQKLRLKLQKIEANLEAREKNRDQIIKRRVEELLDPNSNTDDWNSRTNPKHALESQPIASSPSAEPGPHPENGNAVSIPPGPRGSDTGNASFLASSSSAAAAMELPPPSEVLKTLRNLRRLFTGHVEEQKRLQGFIDRRSRPMTELIAEGVVKEGEENDIAGTLLGLRKQLSNNERGQKDQARDWRQAWSEYQSDLRLLQLDVEESQVALAEQGSELERAQQDFEVGNIHISRFQQAVTKHRIAEFQLKRTAEILRLYADIEKNEPELNPDYKAPAADEATGVKPE